MFVFYGIKSRVLALQPLTASSCPTCMAAEQHLAVLGRYVHLYWIPTVALPRTGRLVCGVCSYVKERRSFNAAEQAAYADLRRQTRLPWWFWTGAGLMALLVALIFLIPGPAPSR